MMLAAQAANHTYQFSGTISSGVTQTNGTTTATLPAGTPFTGSFTFSDTQTMTSAPYQGGTMNTFAFSSLTLTMLGTTGTSGPGQITMYDNMTPGLYGVGDRLEVNTTSWVPMTASFGGFQFTTISVQIYDPTGTAFTAGVFPTNMNAASFITPGVGAMQPGLVVGYLNANSSWATAFQLMTLASTTPGAPPSITTTSLPAGVVGVPYTASVAASGPNGDAVTLAVTGLPAGLGYAAATAITGTPQVAGTSLVNVTATDSVTGLSTTATLSLVVSNPAITFNPSLAAGVAGAAYSSTFTGATGGTGVFTYTASGLPAGLALTGTTVAGTPAAAGTYAVALTATDSSGAAITVGVTLTITNPVAVVCSGSNSVESAYVARTPGYVVVNGGLNLLDHLWTTLLTPSTVTFQGGLVNWYQTGLILSWTGTVDTTGCILNHLTVSPAVQVSTLALPGGTAGVAYIAPVTIAWGVAPYNVTVSGLPAGLSYANGNVAGSPTVVGTFNVVVTAVDAVGATATKTLPLTILDQTLGFAPALPVGTVGTAYTAALNATGFGPFTYSATGLPVGLAVGGAAIKGTPTAAGTFSVVLTATDAAGATATATVSLTINAATASHYTIQDESLGKITAVGADYLMVGAKKLIWSSTTNINVNTPDKNLHTITSYVTAGMRVQWKGLRDAATNTVLCSQIEVN